MPEGGGGAGEPVAVLGARRPSAFFFLSTGKMRQRMAPVLGSARWTVLKSQEAYRSQSSGKWPKRDPVLARQDRDAEWLRWSLRLSSLAPGHEHG